MRLSESARGRHYGPPCQRSSYLTAELFGLDVVVHRLVHAHLIAAMRLAHRELLRNDAMHAAPLRIDSYNCRRIAGSQSWSLHARGLAWDVFRTPPGVPPPGGVYTPHDALHPAFVYALERAGFTWGGRWRRPDRPHFEWSSAPPPAALTSALDTVW